MTLPMILGRRASMPWTEKLISKLRDREYRAEYVAQGVKTWIARQIRSLRDQRKWSQGDLGERCEKPQSAISRMEDPDYGQLSLQTLFDVAKAFDVALVVKFVDYPTFLRETKDLSTGAMFVEGFDEQKFLIPAASPNRYTARWSGTPTLGSSQDFVLNSPASNDSNSVVITAAALSQRTLAVGHG